MSKDKEIINKVKKESMHYIAFINDTDDVPYIGGHTGMGEYLAVIATPDERRVIESMINENQFIVSAERLEGAVEVEYITKDSKIIEQPTGNRVSGNIVRCLT